MAQIKHAPWRPANDEERTAVVSIVKQAIRKYGHSGQTVERIANDTVPEVPAPPKRLRTLRMGDWWVTYSQVYNGFLLRSSPGAAPVVAGTVLLAADTISRSMSDADVERLLALKADPFEHHHDAEPAQPSAPATWAPRTRTERDAVVMIAYEAICRYECAARTNNRHNDAIEAAEQCTPPVTADDALSPDGTSDEQRLVDAMRYRWWRRTVLRNPSDVAKLRHRSGEELDAAIDQAILEDIV